MYACESRVPPDNKSVDTRASLALVIVRHVCDSANVNRRCIKHGQLVVLCRISLKQPRQRTNRICKSIV
jgi:hypothetical protein